MKKLIVFDLDGTLAESKSPLDPEMSGLLHGLLDIVKVAVISGGDWPQFETQVVSKLPHDQRLAESIPASCLRNKVLPIFRRLEKALRRRFHRGRKSEDYQFSKEGTRSGGLQGGKVMGRAN